MDIQQQIANERKAYLSAVREQSDRKRIFIYGAGDYGRGIAKLLAAEHIHVDGFVVTQMTYNLESIRRMPVRPAAEVLRGLRSHSHAADAVRRAISRQQQQNFC